MVARDRNQPQACRIATPRRISGNAHAAPARFASLLHLTAARSDQWVRAAARDAARCSSRARTTWALRALTTGFRQRAGSRRAAARCAVASLASKRDALTRWADGHRIGPPRMLRKDSDHGVSGPMRREPTRALLLSFCAMVLAERAPAQGEELVAQIRKAARES